MVPAPAAAVITFQSHPAWLAAQERARERSESIRRHPSFRARKLVAEEDGEEVGRAMPTGQSDNGHRRDESNLERVASASVHT